MSQRTLFVVSRGPSNSPHSKYPEICIVRTDIVEADDAQAHALRIFQAKHGYEGRVVWTVHGWPPIERLE